MLRRMVERARGGQAIARGNIKGVATEGCATEVERLGVDNMRRLARELDGKAGYRVLFTFCERVVTMQTSKDIRG